MQHTEAGLSQHRRSLDGLADAVELKADRAETMTRLAERERVEALAAVVHSKVDATAFGAEKAAWDGKIAVSGKTYIYAVLYLNTLTFILLIFYLI